MVIGGFNVLYPVRVKGLPTRVLVRLPCPNQAVFPVEKTMTEAATAGCIGKNTNVPVPRLHHYGDDPDIGPYMVIEDLGSCRGMGQALEAPRKHPDDSPILRPDIPEHRLQHLYAKMAECVFQLTLPTFPRIGAVVETSPGSYDVSERPFTLNMSNMVQLSNVHTSVFPPKDTTYQTVDEWYTVLADMQLATLLFQHNDMISSEDDCRNKFVSRQIFRTLAKQGRLSTFGRPKVIGPWAELAGPVRRIQCRADMPALCRPVILGESNVIVNNDDEVLGAIDWEYAYAGPTQFVLDPPCCCLTCLRCGTTASTTGPASTRGA